MTVTDEQYRFEPERDDKQQRGFLHALSRLAIKHQALRRSLLLACSVLVPFSMGVRECERVPVGENCAADGGSCTCEYEGKTYAVGDKFKAADGCNQCGCNADGLVACTLVGCVPSPVACGGIAGLKCADGQYCQFAPDAACGAADRTGTCEKIPEICDLSYSAVCGCDGTTYGNPCAAAAKGVSVASKGECKTPSTEVCEYNGKQFKVGESYP
ncbi:MAG: hypothetical protein RL701_4037, partial [Pseudomonadota bacterium]